MFDGIKRKAAAIGVRGLFDRTMREVLAAPRETQIAIAMSALPKVAGIGAIPDPQRAELALRSLAQFATSQRQLAATIAEHDADPRFAPWAIVESWCQACMIDPTVAGHIQSTLDAWASSLRSPDLDAKIREATHPGQAARVSPSPPAVPAPPPAMPAAPAAVPTTAVPEPERKPHAQPEPVPAPAPAPEPWPPVKPPKAGWQPPPLPDWAQPKGRRDAHADGRGLAPESSSGLTLGAKIVGKQSPALQLVIPQVMRVRPSQPPSPPTLDRGDPPNPFSGPDARGWMPDPNTGIRRRVGSAASRPRADYWAQLDGRVTDEMQQCPTCKGATNTVHIRSTRLCCMCGRPR